MTGNNAPGTGRRGGVSMVRVGRGDKGTRGQGEIGLRPLVSSSPCLLFQGTRAWRNNTSPPAPRRGLTLLEVLIALSIFLVAMTAIGKLISLGARASREARLEADAVLRAETALSEIIAGVYPMTTAPATAFTDDPEWYWSLTVSEGPHIDLVRLDVAAFRQAPGGEPVGSVTLSRLVRSPDLFLQAALAAEEE